MKHINKNCKKCGVELTTENKYKNKWWDVCIECTKKHQEKNNKARMFVNGKYIPNTHALYKPGHYKTFEDAAFQSLSKYATSKEGQVYIITNPAWEDWIKVGMAIDANDRCNGYQTSSPMRDYRLEYSKEFNNRRTAETKAHKLCKQKAKETKGEWFKLQIKEAINLIESITEEQNERETA